VGRVKLTGSIFDLTYKDLAEKEGFDTKKMDFSPVLVIPSANYTLPAISKSLIGKNVGDKYTLELKAKEAFGEYNPKLVKTVGLGVFTENGIQPSVGDVVTLDGVPAYVMSVSGGRVLVNFNNILAGKDVIYEIEIVKVLNDDKEKCAAIFKHYANKEPESVNITEKDVVITTKGDLAEYLRNAIIGDINKYVNKEYKVQISSS
ncbi:MAG: peptidylprolyl isomerase, partial [Nanoarchaeota archaeon]|nr:peptidylprolyl isomerase [Nanoarchaeota archaeon]